MAYTGTSIVDYLKSIGQDSSFSNRTALAAKYGISGYSGTAEQNTRLLSSLRGTPSQTPTTTAPTPTRSGSTAPLGSTQRTNELLGGTYFDPNTGKQVRPFVPSVPDYSSVSNNQQANAAINAGQTQDASAKTTSEEPPLKSYYQTASDIIKLRRRYFQDVKSTIVPETKVEAPNFEQRYQDLRSTYGINDLEGKVNDLNAQKAEIEAAKRARATAERGKTVATNVIAGRVSEVERQENERIDALDRQIKVASDQLMTKYNIVGTIMKVAGMDYDAAVAKYDKEVATNISVFNTVKGITEEAKNDIEKAKDNARASLNVIYNNITAGGLDPNAITPDQKTLITKLEVQAGLPVGFYSTLKNKNPKADVISTTNWTSSDNKEYVSVVTRDTTTGEIKTSNVLLGRAKATSTRTTEADKKVAYKQSMNTQLSSVKGTDGFVSPEDWAKARSAWAVNSPYGVSDFDEAFSNFVNPSRPKDYAGFGDYISVKRNGVVTGMKKK